MTPVLTLRLLGTPEIALQGAPIETDRRKAMALLAYLAVTGQAHSREALAALFWPEHEPAKAHAYLRRTLWEINQALGEGWLEADRETAGLSPQAKRWVDVLRFQALVAKRTEGAEAVARLKEAVELYRGDFLAGMALRDSPGFEEWQTTTAEALRRQFGEALQALAEALAAAGDVEAALATSRRWLALDTLNEAAHRQVMELLALSGQRHAALRQYEACARLLKAELDVAPEAATAALYQRIKAEGGPELAGPQPTQALPEPPQVPDIIHALRSARRAPKHNLPAPITSFVGREKEIADLKDRLQPDGAEKPRLITLTGAGGTGKTRLALRAAGELVGAFADGVWFVEFAPVANPALAPQTVLAALKLREEKERPALSALADYVCERTLLLILDNCEHLIDACAQLAEALLRAGPNVWIVATSREALGITGEATVQVPSLSLPPVQTTQREALLQSESGRLFVERARAAWAGFEFTEDNVPAVARVCRRLDGIPLAIELAAARVKTLRVEQIAARLDDRFRLLTAGNRTALPRHQTLRALIDWSHNLLSEPERRLLRRLSVFAGGWTLEAAEAVCGDDAEVFELLMQLVNKSLVVADRRPGAETRYRLLETIRQYARERLLDTEEGQALRQQHLEFFVQLAEKWEPEMHGPNLVAALNALETEHDNLRAALEWAAASGQAMAALRLSGAVWELWNNHSYWSEGREWLSKALALPGAEAHSLPRAKALNGLAYLTYIQIGPPAGQPFYEESVALWRKLGAPRQPGYLHALRLLGEVIYRSGDPARGRALVEESLALARAAGDKIEEAWSLFNLALWAHTEGQMEAARTLYLESLALHRQTRQMSGMAYLLKALAWLAADQLDWEPVQPLVDESVRLFRDLGDRNGLANALFLLGISEMMGGRLERAELYYTESLELAREINAPILMTDALFGLGWLSCLRGDASRARGFFEQHRALGQETRWLDAVVYDLVGFAMAAATEGQAERAVQLLAAAVARRVAMKEKWFRAVEVAAEQLQATLRAKLDEAAFVRAWAAGERLTSDEAARLATDGTTDEQRMGKPLRVSHP